MYKIKIFHPELNIFAFEYFTSILYFMEFLAWLPCIHIFPSGQHNSFGLNIS